MILLRGLLQDKITFGNGVCGLRGEVGIFRFEFNRDDTRLFHLECRKSIVVAFEYTLFRRLRHRVLGEADQPKQRAKE